MKINSEYCINGLTKEEKEGVWRILCMCDDEFLPRLSARESSVQKNLQPVEGGETGALPHTYFEELMKQEFILAKDEAGKVIGFMSFRKDYICDALLDFGRSLYITTVCVDHGFRKQGVMKRLYETMEKECTAVLGESKVSTRTWSTNHAHINGLGQRGYDAVKVLENDRGEKIDTIYFGKEVRQD